MTTHKLRFQDVTGSSTNFVDPMNISNNFVHKSEKVRKNIANMGRVAFYRNEFAQVRQYDVTGCGSDSCTKDEVHSRVILSGVNPEELALNWEDLKANVDTAIASGALNGLRLPLGLDSLIVTDKAVKAE